MEDQYHNDGGNEHGYWTKKPQQQIKSKIQSSKPKWPEFTSPYNCQLHTTRRNFTTWVAYQIACTDKVPWSLNKTWKSKKKADQETHVLDGNGRCPCVSIDYFASEDAGRVCNPSSNDRAKSQRDRGQVSRCRCIGAGDGQSRADTLFLVLQLPIWKGEQIYQNQFLSLDTKDGKEREGSTGLHNTFDPSSLVVVLVAHQCGVRPVEVIVKKEEVVAKHEQQPSRDQHQIKLLLLETHDFLSFWSNNRRGVSWFSLKTYLYQKKTGVFWTYLNATLTPQSLTARSTWTF